MTGFVIVTPVFNGAKYIAKTLASIAAQTDPDWVHYLVDGGSTDGTLEILEKAVAEDPRRRLITGPDRGLYDAVFKGFDQAAADGVALPETVCTWLGCDDLLAPWAISTLRHEFAAAGADWVATLPTIWDFAGRQVVVQTSNWYPRRWIRMGLFNNGALGSIQQESTFFTYRLFSKLSADIVESIRASRYAGDYMLLREFARYAPLVSVPVTVSGFRQHGANLSTVGLTAYFDEIRASGVRIPPAWLQRVLRVFYRPLATLATAAAFRKSCLQFQQQELRAPGIAATTRSE